jgi:2,4-dienoyl-CoA reductase-like NADH-dependent reductase (Old Yellow Enzyme family)
MTSHLFSPIKLAGVELSNRLVVSPMCQYSADNGSMTDWHTTHIGMLANSGAGLFIVEATGVEARGRITHGCVGLYSDANEAAMKRVIDHARKIGTAKFGIQLAHAGRKASAQRPWQGAGPLQPGEDPWETIAPSPIPWGPGWHTPREMTEQDIADVTAAFVAAAKRALRIGFDTIELHAAHGYLLHAFASAISNQRTDRYGGSLENRLRFPLEVMAAVRAVVPASSALGARLTGSDWLDGGITAVEAVALAKAFRGAGADYVDVSSGALTHDARNPTTPCYNAPLASEVKRVSGIATRTVGLIITPQEAEAVIASGQADMVALGRGVLNDPRWGWHAAFALGDEIARVPQYLRVGPKLWPGQTMKG